MSTKSDDRAIAATLAAAIIQRGGGDPTPDAAADLFASCLTAVIRVNARLDGDVRETRKAIDKAAQGE